MKKRRRKRKSQKRAGPLSTTDLLSVSRKISSKKLKGASKGKLTSITNVPFCS